MDKFTLEFLPHFSGGVVRNANFSLYEIKWNDHGKWGFFEFQINLPTNVYIQREVEINNRKHILACDAAIRDSSDEWPYKRLHLYEAHKDEILTRIPAPYFLNVSEHLILRLMLSFTAEARKRIAEQFRFSFPNVELQKMYFSDVSINALFKKYSQHLSIE